MHSEWGELIFSKFPILFRIFVQFMSYAGVIGITLNGFRENTCFTPLNAVSILHSLTLASRLKSENFCRTPPLGRVGSYWCIGPEAAFT